MGGRCGWWWPVGTPARVRVRAAAWLVGALLPTADLGQGTGWSHHASVFLGFRATQKPIRNKRVKNAKRAHDSVGLNPLQMFGSAHILAISQRPASLPSAAKPQGSSADFRDADPPPEASGSFPPPPPFLHRGRRAPRQRSCGRHARCCRAVGPARRRGLACRRSVGRHTATRREDARLRRTNSLATLLPLFPMIQLGQYLPGFQLGL